MIVWNSHSVQGSQQFKMPSGGHYQAPTKKSSHTAFANPSSSKPRARMTTELSRMLGLPLLGT
eukprot:7824891-Prorocentrum_lima.AAC.1